MKKYLVLAIASRVKELREPCAQLCERLTPALLAKAFCGELIPQDPNDKSADRLLERTRKQKSAVVQNKLKKSKQL